ncbi:MAG: hypothetical protein JOZ05_02120 [Acetobacteraceae bacterium]|nr:hypothetical protein [Acetobacteraceae bacterium]
MGASANALARDVIGLRNAWLALAAASGIVLAGVAHAQGSPTASDAVPPATSQAAPAEIQPGHPPPPATGSLGSSGPQAAVPSPLPGNQADTQGGSARHGIISPPAATGDQDINKGAPGARTLGTPVIPPPGTPGGDRTVVPK